MITTPSTHRLASDVLVAMLDDARQRTFELTQDLPIGRHLGPKLSTVNPPQWEIGHIGFFYDYFVLHKLFGLPDYQIVNAQKLYDSMGWHTVNAGHSNYLVWKIHLTTCALSETSWLAGCLKG